MDLCQDKRRYMLSSLGQSAGSYTRQLDWDNRPAVQQQWWLGSLAGYAGEQQANGLYNLSFGLASLLGPLAHFGPGTPVSDEDGWIDWMTWTPPKDKLIQYKHEDWDTTMVGYPKDLHPETNIYGLKWRLTGIGKQ